MLRYAVASDHKILACFRHISCVESPRLRNIVLHLAPRLRMEKKEARALIPLGVWLPEIPERSCGILVIPTQLLAESHIRCGNTFGLSRSVPHLSDRAVITVQRISYVFFCTTEVLQLTSNLQPSFDSTLPSLHSHLKRPRCLLREQYVREVPER
jgi:hypothetical protein